VVADDARQLLALVIMQNTMSSGRRLRATREAQGRSLRDVAREAQIDASNLSRIERGIQRPSLDALVRIGQVLGLRNVVNAIELFVDDAGRTK
jgi:transcriptional regulator with XRE-family HTH domain